MPRYSLRALTCLVLVLGTGCTVNNPSAPPDRGWERHPAPDGLLFADRLVNAGDGQRRGDGPASHDGPETPPVGCGDGVREGSEACDGTDFGGASCKSLGFDQGPLSCTSACAVVATACIKCTAPVPPPTVKPTRIVSATLGADATAQGTCLAYRTITAALKGTSSGDVVWVGPGTYDTALGESFPLVVPDGVALVGNEATRGGGTLIRGGGSIPSVSTAAAVHGGADSVISGLGILAQKVSSPYAHYGVWTAKSPALISRNTFTGSNGIKMVYTVTAAQATLIKENQFSTTNSAIELSGSSPRIRGNSFTSYPGSASGAVTTWKNGNAQAVPDLGQTADPGGNTFAGGTAIHHTSCSSLYALGNSWPSASDPVCGTTIVVATCSTGAGKVYWGPLAQQLCAAP